MLTAQQIFDQSTAFLLKQGVASRSLTDRKCYYRHPEDPALRCAVGCLIPDHLYNLEMDNHNGDNETDVNGLFERFPEEMNVAGLSYDHIGLLSNLQSAHDYDLAHGTTAWIKRLKEIAKARGLSTAVLE
jgi:hypothetical protein